MSVPKENTFLLPESITLPKSVSSSLTGEGPDVQGPAENSELRKVYGRDLNTGDLLFASHAEQIIFDRVIEMYGLSGLTSLESPQSISTTSRKIIITCDQGTFFLKEKAKYCCNPGALRLSSTFQSHIAEETGLAPKIIPTIEGQPYCVIGSKIFLMTEYKTGRLFRGNTEDIQNAAGALAVLHTSSLNFSYPEDSLLKSSLDDANIFIDMADGLPSAIQDPYKKEAISFLRRTVQRRPNGAVSVPIIVNHGDFAPFNLVFSDNGVEAINDFDNCNLFVRVRDLADPIITFCDGVNYAGATSSFRRPISHKFSLEKASVFLKSYCDVAGELLPGEREVLVTEVLNRWAELMALGIVRGDFAYYDTLQAAEFPEFVLKELPQLLETI